MLKKSALVRRRSVLKTVSNLIQLYAIRPKVLVILQIIAMEVRADAQVSLSLLERSAVHRQVSAIQQIRATEQAQIARAMSS